MISKVKKQFQVEQLEPRFLLSVFTPEQIATAYSLQSQWNGTGETIAIIVADDDPQFVNSTDPNFSNSDLHIFDQHFALPDPPSFTKVGQTGGAPPTTHDPGGAAE